MDGLDGLEGLDGLLGLEGLLGLDGFNGFEGLLGFVGLVGLVGLLGFDGLVGSVGLVGLVGLTGAVPTTVTVHIAVLCPSSVVAVMTALPIEMPLTTPCEDTVALDSSLLDHITFLFEAFSGKTVATSVAVLPTPNSKLDMLRETLLTWTEGLPVVKDRTSPFPV